MPAFPRSRLAGGSLHGLRLACLVLTAAAAAAACTGATPSGAAAAPTASAADLPPASPEAPASEAPAPSASGLRPGFTGSGAITVTIDGTTTTLEGAECGLEQFPDGTYAYAFNVGVPSLGDGGPDYIGIVLPLSGDQPDGTYQDVTATASLAGSGFNVGDPKVTIAGGGTTGTLTGSTRPGDRPIEATFTC